MKQSGLGVDFDLLNPLQECRFSPQTPLPLFSAGKPLAAIAIAMLEDRGTLDVRAPIAQIFPEFAQHDKEKITTLDVLTHRSGMLMPEFAKKTQSSS